MDSRSFALGRWFQSFRVAFVRRGCHLLLLVPDAACTPVDWSKRTCSSRSYVDGLRPEPRPPCLGGYMRIDRYSDSSKLSTHNWRHWHQVQHLRRKRWRPALRRFEGKEDILDSSVSFWVPGSFKRLEVEDWNPGAGSYWWRSGSVLPSLASHSPPQ